MFIAPHCAGELLMKSSMNRKKKKEKSRESLFASIETQLKFNVRTGKSETLKKLLRLEN